MRSNAVAIVAFSTVLFCNPTVEIGGWEAANNRGEGNYVATLGVARVAISGGPTPRVPLHICFSAVSGACGMPSHIGKESAPAVNRPKNIHVLVSGRT